MPEAQADTEFGYLPGAGGIEVLTCGLGIRESGSPYLFIPGSHSFIFGVIRAWSVADLATELGKGLPSRTGQ